MRLDFPGPLVEAVFLRRRVRFLGDFTGARGEPLLAHVPNTGSMEGCLYPGARAILRDHGPTEGRKTRYTWLAIQGPEAWVGVHTGIPNDLVARLVAAGELPGLGPVQDWRREVRVGPHTRFDLWARTSKGEVFVEVKNVSLVLGGVARFPDAATERGRKHLEELTRLVGAGHRCLMVYVVQRADASAFGTADHIDPEYGRAFRRALGAGVEALALGCRVDEKGLQVQRVLPLLS